MTVLQLQGVGVAWSASAPLLEEASFVLDRGLVGLVGANGSGKTTLLAVLAGELAPHDGNIALLPRDAVVAHCPQKVDARSVDIDALATRHDSVAAELSGRLDLDPDQLERWPTLSPGERKRWQIAAALAREPDVLLLDEPTNHLDVEARQRLLDALRRFSGIGIVVSHDRTVLDTLTRATLRLHERRLTLYPGRYSEARLLWQQERASQEDAYAAARSRVRKAEAQLEAARRTQASAERSTNARGRMRNENDHDGRSMLATTRARWAEGRAGRVVETVRSEVDRAKRDVPRIERDATLGGKVFARYERAPNSILFHLERDELRAGDHVVLRDVRLDVGREERVRLVGANGAGKTPQREALVASQSHPERLLYLPQELGTSELNSAQSRLDSSDAAARGQWLSLFAALGSDPDRIVRGRLATASPGEVRKLVLAEALARRVWALVLDEPTNHLDLPSVERLEQALVDYPGAVVLVTHDDTFAAKITTRSLRLERGRVT